jgi:hypothetical protein
MLIDAEPTLLSPVEDDEDRWGEAITFRVEYEIHSCLRCGKTAVVSYIVGTGSGQDDPRWLDLCWHCASGIRRAMAEN